ncbi:MAG TPA: polysaccharide deacetylase family protein [Anaerolineales bacterium]|nr:polysaccharide deacetylase family protein [Anaerolineales bacterium]
MNKQNLSLRFLPLTLSLFAVVLGACQPQTPTVDPNAIMTQAVQTAFASIQKTKPVATSTKTPLPSPTLPLTPPALPATFTTTALNSLDTPHTYINDQCQYLKAKWTSTNAAPGTVVMVIMFHTISKDAATEANMISNQDFKKLMNDLHEAGFQAIYTQELADFLYSNAKIPQRSVLLTQDDRHADQNFTDHFLPYYQEWGWPVVNGWISALGGQDPVLPGNVALSKDGWVDYQAHGVVHNIPMSDSSTDDFLTSELDGSMKNITTYFGKAPIAIIWPGGGFGVRPVQSARKYGYQLGFTTNPRGPLMYNWVPLADQANPEQPAVLAEGPVNDPPMVLPRYWDTDARAHIDEVRRIGEEAAAYEQSHKVSELEYYRIVCEPTYGPIP